MANIFLDANYLIDLLYGRNGLTAEIFRENTVYASALSVHITLYVNKEKVPQPDIEKIINNIKIMSFNHVIVKLAFQGPTSDFEDNVQLHQVAQTECTIFLTRDKKLLSMKYFGKVKISDTL